MRTFVLATEQFAYLYQSGDKGIAFIENEANETDIVTFRSDPEVSSFYRKSPRSGCGRPKTRVYCAIDFLHGCSSQEEQSRERKTHHMTSGDQQ